MRRSIWFLMVAALATLTIDVSAAVIDASTAQQRAQQFIGNRAAGALRAPGARLKLAHAEASAVNVEAADYYVFNSSDGAAFVIVAGDDRVEGVLGYGEGSLDMSDLPCGMAWLLNDYREQMEYLLANPTVQAEVIPSEDGHYPMVMPLLSCFWSQSEPYYNQCPVYQGERCVTGCIATAMAQVMYYWRYPSAAPSLSGYVTRSFMIEVDPLPSRPLDWDSMIDAYNGEYTQAQGDAVARLMRYCGQSARMSYGPNGSGAYVYQQMQGMSAFGYSGNQLARSNYTLEEWEHLLQEDLEAGRPVLYSGNDAMAGGHAFVVDGCYNGLYHLNWGWAGTGNGYFRITSLVVRGYSFLSDHEILHGICPRQTVEPETGYDFVQDGIYYMYNEDGSAALVTYRDMRYDSYTGDVVIPSVVNHDGEELAVIGIGKDAFRNSVGLTSVTLPSTVRTIGEHAFRNCAAMTTVSLPEGLVSIDDQAFANCVGLASIDLPGTVTTIGREAFNECYGLERVGTPSLAAWLQIDFVSHYANPLSYAHRLYIGGQELTDLVIPAAAGAVKRFAFIECTALRSLTLEDGVTGVGEAAFAYCDHIADLDLPTSLVRMDKQAFYGCKALTSMDVPVNVTVLGDALLADCTGLTRVSLPDGLVTIGNNVFNGCSALQELNIPEGVTGIGSGAMSGCSAIKSLVVPSSVKTLGGSAFQGCTSLTDIQLSPYIKGIGASTFQGCSALTAVVVPDSATFIGGQAFYRCTALAEVTLGSGLTSVADKAFYGCLKLSQVTCRALTPPATAGPDCFSRSIYSTAMLRVPAESRSLYKKSGIWPWFLRIVGVNVDFPIGDVNLDNEVNIADVNTIIDEIITTGSTDLLKDLNGDNEVNIADVNALIDMILK